MWSGPLPGVVTCCVVTACRVSVGPVMLAARHAGAPCTGREPAEFLGYSCGTCGPAPRLARTGCGFCQAARTVRGRYSSGHRRNSSARSSHCSRSATSTASSRTSCGRPARGHAPIRRRRTAGLRSPGAAAAAAAHAVVRVARPGPVRRRPRVARIRRRAMRLAGLHQQGPTRRPAGHDVAACSRRPGTRSATARGQEELACGQRCVRSAGKTASACGQGCMWRRARLRGRAGKGARGGGRACESAGKGFEPPPVRLLRAAVGVSRTNRCLIVCHREAVDRTYVR